MLVCVFVFVRMARHCWVDCDVPEIPSVLSEPANVIGQEQLERERQL